MGIGTLAERKWSEKVLLEMYPEDASLILPRNGGITSGE
jgi:hypothetical protein